MSARRANAFLESAFWDVEASLVLGRDGAAAELAYEKALARVEEPSRAAARARRARLAHAVEHRGDALADYAREHGLGGARMTTSSSGVRIYRVVAEAFPRHINYIYFIDLGDQLVQWDCGSGLHRSRAMILDGLALCGHAFGARMSVEDLDVVIVSHGHYDHFGDAGWFRATSGAPLWIHDLDARVIERFQERTALTGRDMKLWLRAAGCDADEAARLVGMYLESKEVFASVPVDRRLRHGQVLFPGGRGRLIHTPGHCPGHVCMRIDDVVLTGDQILSPITPHLSPQALHPGNGIERYVSGIGKLAREEGVRHVLPAHFDPIPDLGARVREIAEDHAARLQRVADVCARGATILDVAAAIFGAQEGYHVLLATLEAGAHVEFLHQNGALAVANIDEVVADPQRPARYVTTSASTVTPNPVDTVARLTFAPR